MARYHSGMRNVLAMIGAIIGLCSSPAAFAWEFSPGPPCLLTHAQGDAALALTYDPTRPVYTITITQTIPWPETPFFSMRFDGPQGRQIGTDRHQLSADGRSLSVADVGFGNVLDGLQFNFETRAIAGEAVIGFSLDGAAEPVAQFRACSDKPPVS